MSTSSLTAVLLFAALLTPRNTIAKSHSPFETSLYNDLAYQRYNITVALGTPPQSFSLLFDTASTDVWVPQANSSGCTSSCPPLFSFDPTTSRTLINTSIPFDARYGLTPDLAVTGQYYTDTVSIAGLEPLTYAPFAIGDLPQLLYVQGNRGILGVGFRFSESMHASPTSPYRGDASKTYTPIWERLALGRTGGKRKFSVWLNAQSARSGTVEFGGENAGKYENRLAEVPLNLSPDGSVSEWNVNLTGVERYYGRRQEKVSKRLTEEDYSTDFTLDTGSPNMYVPTVLYESIVDGLNATEIINGAPYVPCSLRSMRAGYLTFEFAMRKRGEIAKIRVPYSEIIYPPGFPVTVPLVGDRNGEELCYFGIVPTDGPVRLLGATFLRSAYVVFEADKKELRLAQSKPDDCGNIMELSGGYSD